MKGKGIILSIATLLCTACQAQQGGYRLDFNLSKRNFVDSIAITFDQERVIVPVTINGEQRRFLLDTGAGHAVVYDDCPIEGCLPAGTILSHDAIGRQSRVPLVTLPPLTLGTLTLTGCQATLQHRPVKRSDIDGIIGFDLVCRGLQMKIDTRRQLLILTDVKKFFDREAGHRMKYRLLLHVPYLDVMPFSGFRDRVLFDTGSRSLYSMNKQRFDEAEKTRRPFLASQIEGCSVGQYAMGFQGTEALGEVVFLGLSDLRLGRFSFRDVHTLTTQGGSHLGARVLDYGAVVFCPLQKTLIFQPYDHPDSCTVGNSQLQKAIVNANGKPVVGLVWERSEAFKAGLRQGDTILNVEGQAIDSFADYLAFRPLRGRIYTFIILDRRGFKKEVKMTW